MALQSDISIDASQFDPSAIRPRTAAFNERLVKILEKVPHWWDVGAEKYRRMRLNGETPLPAPLVLEQGVNGSLPSREKGREILTRKFEPESGPSRGVFMHIHGGGFTMQSHTSQDHTLKFFAEAGQLTVVSVNYRLAPENPFPAGPEDCWDAAEWLVDNAKAEYGNELMFVGGESAGGHLSSTVIFHLIKTRPNFRFKAAVFNYGAFDLSGSLPQSYNWNKRLVLTRQILDKYNEALAPGVSVEKLRDPMYSPLFTNLPELVASYPHKKLPPAIFTCGTEDPLMDDSIMMGMKWTMSGAEAIIKLYPGACHGFSLFPPEVLEEVKDYRKDVETFIQSKLS